MLKKIVTGVISAALAVGGAVALAPASSAAGYASCVEVTDEFYEESFNNYTFRLQNVCGSYLPGDTKWEFNAGWRCASKSGSRLNLDRQGERVRIDVSNCESGFYSPTVKITSRDSSSNTLRLSSFMINRRLPDSASDYGSPSPSSSSSSGSGSSPLPSSFRHTPKKMIASCTRKGTKIISKKREAVIDSRCGFYQVKLKTKSPNKSVITFMNPTEEEEWEPKVRKGTVKATMYLCEGDSVEVFNEKGKRIATLDISES